MGGKARLVQVLTVVVAFGLTLHAEVLGTFARQVRADLGLLSSEPTLAAWQTSRHDGKIEPAHYETERDSFEVDFARLNRWCATSVSSLQPQVLRAALFYVPPVAQGVLPPLPSGENGAMIRGCRMQAIWYEIDADTSMDILVNELSSFWGKPNGQTTTPDIPGSALWKGVAAWHWKGMNIWVVYDLKRKPGGAIGPRLIVYARRDIPPDPLALDVGSLGYAFRNRVNDAAAQLAAQGPALTASILDRSQCLARPLRPESESLTVSRLAEWLKSSPDAAPARRAAALLVADAYLTCAHATPQSLVPLGAEFATVCPQDGTAYDGNFLRQAEMLDPKGPGGELASLASLGEPCSLRGQHPWPDLVIEKSERLLSEFPADQWTPWIHFAAAGAHATKLSFAYSGGDPEGGIAPLTPAAMRQQRKAAIENFEDFIRARTDTPESVFAWQEAWRLLAGLPPSQIHFGCGCE